MKNILLLICLLPFCTYAQKLPDSGFDKMRIVEPDKIVQADLKEVASAPNIKSDRFYYWYSGNAIHSTQGGFSGRLLNGLYAEYYLNKNLKEQGIFKKGLKDGVWKKWNENGTLSNTTTWKNGLEVQPDNLPFFKRLNPFRKKEEPAVPEKTN